MTAPRKQNHTRAVALCGVLAALALAILLVGGFITIGTFAAPIFAGLCLLPVVIDIGLQWALLCYAAISLLSILLVPDMELTLFFIALAGYYPMLQPRLQRIRFAPLRYGVKFVIFNAALALIYTLLLWVIASPQLAQEFSDHTPAFLALLWLMGNITFFLYDLLLIKVRVIYMLRIRRILFK